jgi:carbon storage regulator
VVLVFARQVEQEIVINGEIRVRVLEVSGGTVKLGIIAPRHIPVHRGEIYEQIIEHNLAAARTAQGFPGKGLEAAALPPRPLPEGRGS